MKPPIFAILFDVGGTLRIGQNDPDSRQAALEQLCALLNYPGSWQDLQRTLRQREETYRGYCTKTLYELSEQELWTQYMLPEYPTAFVAEHAIEFTQLWRGGRDHILMPGAREALHTLKARGYRLGVISNTTSSTDSPSMLAKENLASLFACILTSTSYGRRKPHPAIFLEAARQAGVSPQHCAYVGNDPTRDLIGARQAGFGQVFILSEPQTGLDDPDNDTAANEKTLMQPDGTMTSLSELLNYFPTLQDPSLPEVEEQPRYDAALSTMWGVDQAQPFAQTFEQAFQIGFSRFELNHKVTQALYEQYNHDRFYISTVHEPCPTDLTYEERKVLDVAISSLNEVNRQRAVDDIKRSISLAVKLGSRSVVIHPGTIDCDKSTESRMRKLFKSGQRNSPQFTQLLNEARAERLRYVQPNLERVMRSMEEVIRFAKGSGVALGLENRYHFHDIPIPDELELLLSLCDEDWLGFQYDVGHAHTLDALGFVRHFEWLERFSSRMIGVHLHDVIGITDHQAPGKGDVDFTALAPFIPASAQRTLEIGPQASLEELSRGLAILVEKGCIQKL